MTEYVKEPHKSIFTGPTICGKTHLVLDLIEKEYNKHFDYIIIICPTLQWNKIYHSRTQIENDDKDWLIRPKDTICLKLRCGKVTGLKYCHNCQHTQKHYLLLTISLLMKALARGGSPYQNSHYLWLLTQSYSAIPNNLRRQSNAIFVWYPKERADLKMKHDENNVLTDDELFVVKDFLRTSKHACLYIRNEHPRGFKLLNHV